MPLLPKSSSYACTMPAGPRWPRHSRVRWAQAAWSSTRRVPRPARLSTQPWSRSCEKGIDISNESPRKLTEEMGRSADVVVTMGCGDACPVYPGKRYVDWELTDPAGKQTDEVRLIRDDIERRVRDLVDSLLEPNT